MAEIVRILRDENFKGVLIPDHTPAMTCAASWHAGKAFALGYMRALVQNADALGAVMVAATPRWRRNSSDAMTRPGCLRRPLGDSCGEGAVWSARSRRVYWVDMKRFLVHPLDWASGSCGPGTSTSPSLRFR